MNLAEFTTRIWTEYPRDLCHNRPGHKARLETAAKKIDKSLYKQILLDMDALKRYDRKQHRPDRWPLISTFLNQRCWERLIDSVMEIRKKEEKKEPEKCKCGNPVDIGPTGECVECYENRVDPNQQNRKKVLQDLGLYSPGQSRSEVIENCRALMSPSVKSGEAFKSLEIPCLKNLSRDSTEMEKGSTPSNSENNSGLGLIHPAGSKEWFEQNHPEIPTEYSGEHGLHLLGDKK